MNAIIIVEIVICVLLALGIATAALLTFIKGRNRRPSLLVGSSTIAVALLIGCLVCSGIQINKTRAEAEPAEFEELAQVRVESVGKDEQSSSKQVSSKKATSKTETKPTETEPETVDTDKVRNDLLAAYFGDSSSDNKTSSKKSTPSKSKSKDTEIIYDFSSSQNDNSGSDDVIIYDFSNDSDDQYYSEDYSDDYVGGYDEANDTDVIWNDSDDQSSDTDDQEDDSWDWTSYFDNNDSSDSSDYEYLTEYEGEDGDSEDYSYFEDESEDDYTEPEQDDYSEPEPEYTEPEPIDDGTDSDSDYVEDTDTGDDQGDDSYSWDGSVLTNMSGVNWGPTGKETYYNMDMSGVVGVMRGMGFSEEEYPYYVRDDGCKMLGPYIMVAANLDHFPRGSVVECSLGAALVCDTGGFAYSDVGWSQLDIATAW